MCPLETPRGSNPPSDRLPKRASRSARTTAAARHSPLSSSRPAPRPRRRGTSHHIACGRVAGEGRGQRAAVLLVVGVRIGVRRALHRLGRLGDLHLAIAVDLDERVVEGVGGVDGVQQLADGAPALGGALLEEADGVAVAVLDVVELRLLEGGRQRDARRPGRHAPLDRDGGDQCGVLGLLEVDLDACGRRPRPCTRSCRSATARRRGRRGRRPPATAPRATTAPMVAVRRDGIAVP